MPGFREPLVLMESKDPLVLMEHKEPLAKVSKEPLDSPVPKVLPDSASRVPRVPESRVLLDTPERRDLQEPEFKARLVLGSRELPVTLVLRDLLVLREPKVLLAPEFRVVPEPLASRVLLDLRELPGTE